MNREEAMEKIKKCLALAKSTNPHEAAVAMRQAQKLMDIHDVTERDMSIADVSEVSQRAAMQAVSTWEWELVSMIASVFGCRTMTGWDAAGQRKYDFFGIGATPEVASYAYKVLAKQCSEQRTLHIKAQPKNCKRITKTARGDAFAMGWVAGVRCKVQALAGNDADMALIDAYLEIKYPETKLAKIRDSRKGQNVRDADSYLGYRAASSAQLHHGVGSTEQAPLLRRA